MEQKIVKIGSAELAAKLYGAFDANMKLVEAAFAVTVHTRPDISGAGEVFTVSGSTTEGVDAAARAIETLARMGERSETLAEQTVLYVINMVRDGREGELEAFDENCICVTAKGKPIKPKTLGQKAYVDAIQRNTVTLGIGPAGTGKTYLAVAMAVRAYKAKEIDRIILTRPAVEAGEKLGFLPGDLQSKVDPYLRPLYDALFEMLGAETVQRYMERGDIEIAPLAYMRGRTLDDSFIILDEAQNTTPEQMKMFLTRLGFNSKMVVTGDVTQIDLPDGKMSGLKQVMKILQGVEDIAICTFRQSDVVRHQLVQRIIAAYEKFDNARAEARNRNKKEEKRGKNNG